MGGEVNERSSSGTLHETDGQEDNSSDDTELLNTIDILIEQLNSLGPDCTQKLCNLLGMIGSKFVKKNIKEDSKNISGLYKDVDALKQLNPYGFLKDRNTMLVSFISNAVGYEINTTSNPF